MWRRGGHQGAGPCTPVPGSGMPTKKNQAPESEFLNLSFVFSRLFAESDNKLSKSGNAFHDIQDFSMSSRMNGIGSRFPITQMGMARRIGTFKRAGEARQSASQLQNRDHGDDKDDHFAGYFSPSREASPCTRVSVITYPHFSVWNCVNLPEKSRIYPAITQKRHIRFIIGESTENSIASARFVYKKNTMLIFPRIC